MDDDRGDEFMTWVWFVWLLCILVTFALLEWLGWHRRFGTFSRSITTLGQQWPLSIFLWGFLFGGLAVHFFWHWCP